MIKKAADLKPSISTGKFGGKGDLSSISLLTAEEMQGKGRMFARNTLAPGCSLGKHTHTGDIEAYYILQGEGCLDDNGTLQTVRAGDLVFTDNGESHSLENTGSTPLEFIALILYT